MVLSLILCFIPLVGAFCIQTFALKMKIPYQLLALLYGLICVLPVSVIQYFLGQFQFFHDNRLVFILLKSILLYGLIEEGMKFAFANLLPSKNQTIKDFLFLSMFMGLSLGCFESVIYYLDHLQKAYLSEATLMLAPIFVRIFTSDLIHAFCAGLLGLFVFEAKEKRIHVSLLIFAVLLHGVYDFFAVWAFWIRYFAIAVVLFAGIECRIKYSMYNSEEK